MANRKRTYYFISIQLKNNYVIDMGRAWRYRRYNQDRQYNGKRKKKTNAMNDNESHVGPGWSRTVSSAFSINATHRVTNTVPIYLISFLDQTDSKLVIDMYM